jgi:hypothetical protein
MNVCLLFVDRRVPGHAVHPGRRPRPRLGDKRITFNKQQAHSVCRPLIGKRLDLSVSRHRGCVYDYASFNGVGDERKAVSSC